MNLDELLQEFLGLGSQQRGAAPNQIGNTLRPASLSHSTTTLITVTTVTRKTRHCHCLDL